MSHQDLQRVTVRMLFDPRFAARVHDGEPVPELSAQELGWLRATDPRAWTVDHQRPARTLNELTAEFPVSTALVVGRTRQAATVQAFFQSTEFHAAVQDRGSLDVAFARYLARLDLDPHLADIVALEAAQARIRREVEVPPARMDGLASGQVVRARGVAAVQVDIATLDAMNRIEERLFALRLVPAAALAHDAPGLPDLPPRSGQPDALVLQNGIRRLGQVVCRTLQALEHPQPLARMAELSQLPAHVAPQLLGDLTRSGLATAG